MARAPSRKLNRARRAARLRRVRLLTLDVDGVLTDGGLYYDDRGRQLRKFNVKDGLGLQRVRASGVEVALVSAGRTEAVRHRARTLGVEHVIMGSGDKAAAVAALAQRLGMGMEAVAHMGDDVTDLGLFGVCGLAVAVADAVPEALRAAAFVTRSRGGEGAVREVCDLIVRARTAMGRRRGSAPGERP